LNLIKSSSALLASSIAIVFFSVILGIMTARFLGPELRGYLYLLMQIISITSLVLSFGLGASYQYFLRSKIINKKSIVSHLSAQLLLIGSLVFAFCLFFFIFDLQSYYAEFQSYIVFVGIGIILNIVITYFNGVLMTTQEGIYKSSILNGLSSFINLFLFALMAFIFYVDVKIAIIIYLLSLIIKIFPIIRIIYKSVKVDLGLWRENNKEIITYGIASFYFNVAVILLFKAHTFIISFFLGLEDLGFYAVSVTFADAIALLPSAIGTALFAKLPSLSREEKLEIIASTCRFALAAGFFLTLFTYLGSNILISTLLGIEFFDSIEPLKILSIGIIPLSISYVFANFYAGSGKPIISANVFFIGLIINVVANCLLTPILGINGAAFSQVISYFIIAVTFYFVIRKSESLKVSEIIIPKYQDIITLRSWTIERFNRKKN